jgi:hypothetical protein
MSGLEQTVALMQYFINNCKFDNTGKSYCGRKR